MKKISYLALALFCLYLFLLIGQIWFAYFSYAVFFKISLTVGIIWVMLLGILIFLKNAQEDTEQRKNKYIN